MVKAGGGGRGGRGRAGGGMRILVIPIDEMKKIRTLIKPCHFEFIIKICHILYFYNTAKLLRFLRLKDRMGYKKYI